MSTASLLQQQLFDCCRNSANRNVESLRQILKQLDQQKKRYLIDAEDASQRTPLSLSIETGKPLDFVNELLNYPARITSRILLVAVRYGNLDVLKLLREYGADYQQSYHGLSLLHECILLHKNNLINFLIEIGNINPNVVDFDNQTPLFYAISRTNIEAIRILLDYNVTDVCSISTHSQEQTCFHAACELGIDEVIPSMLERISALNMNKLSSNDQTPFDLFLSCYLFTKNSLYMNEVSLEKFSSLFDLFISYGAKMHHLTKAYRRTRAPYVTKILLKLLKKKLHFSEIILQTDRETIFTDLQSLICQSIGDWPYLVESNDDMTIVQQQIILRQLFELFILAYFKSINKQPINKKSLTKYCSANGKDSKMKQILWIYIKNFLEPMKTAGSLKSICRTKILLRIESINKNCTSNDLEISKNLESYLLFFQMI